MGAVVGAIIALILIIIGIVSLRDKHTRSANMKVTSFSAPCQLRIDRSGDATIAQFECVANLTFDADGKTWNPQNVRLLTGRKLVVGDSVQLRYAPADPSDARQESNPKTTAMVLIGVGLFVGGLTSAIAYASIKYKAFATVEGATSIMSSVFGR